MTEAEFVDLFDCRFPYGDAEASRALIQESVTISANAAFAVAYELAYPPHGSPPWTERRMDDLTILRGRLHHPLAGPVLSVVERLIRGHRLTVEETVALMRTVEQHKGQYAALSLIYMACDDPAAYDERGIADTVDKEIRERWDGA